MILSKSEYISSINSLLADNSTQQISPEDLRTSLANLVDSVPNFLADREINAANISTPDIRTTRVGDLAIGKMHLVHRTSVDNSAFGYYSLGANYVGSGNTALGSYALGCNLYGDHNIGVGFNAVAGNVDGSGNVGIGNYSLHTTKKGDFNIAIGHGAGNYIGEDSSYNFYVGSHPINSDSLCDIVTGSGGPPLLFGDLKNIKLGVGVNTLHDNGAVQVAGDVAPSATGVYHVGNSNFPWKSVNETVYFSGGKVAVGTEWPSGDQGLMTVAGNIVPSETDTYSIGYRNNSDATKNLFWDGYFNDILVSGNAVIHDLQYNTINECLYDCKTLHLATSGLCDGSEYGFHNSAVCGYLNDEGIDGAGFEVHSSGSNYVRDYRFIYKFPDPSLTCLEADDHFARSRWLSNISIQIESGKHLQTDRVLGDSKLSLATQSGCYGLFFRSHSTSGNRVFLSPEANVSGNYSYVQDVNFIGNSGATVLANGNPSGYNFTVSHGVVDSGVTVAQKFASRINSSMLGFGLEYHDDITNATDRFSTHIYNNQSGILEAVTVLRSGGTVDRTGLFGITNIVHSSASPPILPETIFNVQSSGSCDVRFSSSSGHLDNKDGQWFSRTSLELLGNGNTRSSGLHISYNPSGDGATLGNTVADFSLIRPDGTAGQEIGFMSVSESGYVGIGYTKNNDYRAFNAHAPLTISHSGALSGTISMREQLYKPSLTADFGKLYIKPTPDVNKTQSLYFLDDEGNEFDILGGKIHIYGDDNGNTYGGWYTPKVRQETLDVINNTFVGFGAGHEVVNYANNNTLLGYLTGSGMNYAERNTIIGSLNLTHAVDADDNIIIGYQNATPGIFAVLPSERVENTILIGNKLFYNNVGSLEDFTLAIGFGTTPLVKGSLGGPNGRNFSLYSLAGDKAIFSIVEDEHVFSIKNDNDGSRDLSIISIQDTDSALEARGYLSMRFGNKVDEYKTLVDFDPSGTMTNTPSFTSPNPRRPFVAVSGDLKLRGAIRFSDGTSLDSSTGLSGSSALDFTDLPLASNYIVNTDTTYVATQVDSVMAKMNLDSLANYIGSGFASVANNCNFIFTNIDNKSTIDTVNNSYGVFIGCEVATNATGWKHAVMIGEEAGRFATMPNVGLASDWAPVFIGYKAGYDADLVENSIFIGTNAGNNADKSTGSIFIGSNAGLYSESPNSIGIGENALRGVIHKSEGGAGNIEIVTGLLDDQRLMYSSGNLHNRLNIQNTVAGDTSQRRLSIGDAVLEPDAPLSVRRDSRMGGHATSDYVQSWHSDDDLRSYVDASGDYIWSSGSTPAWYGNYEGIMLDYIYGPTAYDETPAKSGAMLVRGPDFAAGQVVFVVNRDPMLDIHGPGAVGGPAFVVTNRVNGENRPVYVSCSGTE